MKKILLITLMLAAGVFISPFVSAQSFTSLQYTFGVPFGGLRDHTSQVSWRGFTFEYHKEVAKSVTVGVNLAYNVFNERKPFASYTVDNATVSGVQFRYNNIFPMAVNAHYSFGTSLVIPYVGLGVGTVFNLRNTDMGLFTFEQRFWHFMISPEAGLLFDVADDTSIKFNAIYDKAFRTKNASGFGNLNISLGIVFNSW
jgi:hypothetical protein